MKAATTKPRLQTNTLRTVGPRSAPRASIAVSTICSFSCFGIVPPMRPLLPVNELTMNLTSERVDDRYLKVFIVAQAVVAEVLCKLFAVLDCL
jgi:hypothetical protein